MFVVYCVHGPLRLACSTTPSFILNEVLIFFPEGVKYSENNLLSGKDGNILLKKPEYIYFTQGHPCATFLQGKIFCACICMYVCVC